MEGIGLFGRYHRLFRDLAAHSEGIGDWRSELQRIVQSLDDDCRNLSRARGNLLRQELSSQIEQELLGCTDPARAAVLAVALKHLDA